MATFTETEAAEMADKILLTILQHQPSTVGGQIQASAETAAKLAQNIARFRAELIAQISSQPSATPDKY